MGRGATRLCGDELVRAGIEAAGWTVSSEEIDAVDESNPEIARVSELIRRLATRVLGAVDARSLPLEFAGNCKRIASGSCGSTHTLISTIPRRTPPGSSM
jgi:hypothetical protein